MQRSSLSLTLVLCLGAGCAPRLALVSIDRARIPLEAEVFASATIRPPAPVTKPSVATVPAIKARNVFVGSGSDFAKDAIEAAKRNQERAFKQALAELKSAYLAEARSGAQEKVLKLRLAYEQRFRDLYAALRVLFEAHAAKVGPLWTRVATIRGFPEKAGRVRTPPEADIVGRAEAKEAAEAKAKIEKLDAEYRTEVARKVEGLRQEWRSDLTELEAGRIVALDAAGIRAEADALKMVTEVLKGLEQSMIRDIERLPAVPGSKVNLKGAKVPNVDLPTDTGAKWSNHQRLTRKMDLFARLHGYRLVNAGPGVRDVTKEYLAWETRQVGH